MIPEGRKIKNMENDAVVITGGSSGLGRAYAEAWAKNGRYVYIIDIDKEGAQRTIELIGGEGKGKFIHCDISNVEEAESAASMIYKTTSKADILVNNAGVGGAGAVSEIPIRDWQFVLNVNLWGAINMCHAFIPYMKEQGRGHIVNISSLAGIISAPRFASYNVSKAGVMALSQTLKTELAPYRIGITVVCPPVFKTNIIKNSLDRVKNLDYDISGEIALLHSAMETSRIKPADIAEMTIRAVEKNRLYVIPGLPLKCSWLSARIAPSAFYGLSAIAARCGLHEKIYKLMAKRGLL